MSIGHAHSHRPRRPTHRSRDVDLSVLDADGRERAIKRAQRRLVRLERHRTRLAAVAVEVVVQVPGQGNGGRGQRQGQIQLGRSDRWVMQSAARLALERRLAAEAASRV